MTRSVVFTTPGLIDLEAFTTFGISSKPKTDTPIGFFGTGLKYAIAVLVREGHEVTLYRGRKEYHFVKEEGDHRGKTFEWISMSKKRGWFNPQTKLPFTTELGKNWDLWQAFRELYSNTIDEGGQTIVVDAIVHNDQDRTVIQVSHPSNELFVQEFFDREKTFLPEALREQTTSAAGVQCFEKPSNHVYYRGIRIMDLPKPSAFTWNILKLITLTEDRTAKYDWEVKQAICEYISKSEDEGFIARAIATSEESWENKFDYSFVYSAPSKVFLDVIEKRLKRDRKPVPYSVKAHYHVYRPPPPELPSNTEMKLEVQVKEFLEYLRDRIEEVPQAWRDLSDHVLIDLRDALWNRVEDTDE